MFILEDGPFPTKVYFTETDNDELDEEMEFPDDFEDEDDDEVKEEKEDDGA